MHGLSGYMATWIYTFETHEQNGTQAIVFPYWCIPLFYQSLVENRGPAWPFEVTIYISHGRCMSTSCGLVIYLLSSSGPRGHIWEQWIGMWWFMKIEIWHLWPKKRLLVNTNATWGRTLRKNKDNTSSQQLIVSLNLKVTHFRGAKMLMWVRMYCLIRDDRPPVLHP